MKPYDVRQAIEAVNAAAGRALEQAGAAIEGARLAAVERLETEATVLDGTPALDQLVRESSFVRVAELDDRPRRLYAIDLIFQGSGNVHLRCDDAPIPFSKKHRVLVFFLPVES